ncbi:MAG: hypothetical protein A2X12_04010, partial [Bacteroidetes bacterium GWE2_29_8]
MYKFIFFILLLTFFSCKKDKYDTDYNSGLSYSVSEISFDTVFTTVGTITKNFKIYNPTNHIIVISKIKVGSGKNSFFRINVNGASGYEFSNIEIYPGDSMYVFLNLTIDPTNQNNPLLIKDSLLFSFLNTTEKVILKAYGQDAYFHTPKYPSDTTPYYSIISKNEVWTSDKPHVIMGYLFIDSLATLRIESGVKIYMYNGASLIVYNGGSLKIKGIKDSPVLIQGFRQEEYYKNEPGQWDRIWLSKGSINNTISYAIIKNGTVGIHADTVGNYNPTLRINNTIISNMSVSGIFAQGAKIEGYNCVISNCGETLLSLTIGGEYDFKHCTFANYWIKSTRQSPSIFLKNYYKDITGTTQIRNINKAYFGNCIVYGNFENEFLIDKVYDPSSVLNYKLEYCLMKYNIQDANIFNCILNQDPLFVNSDNNDYKLKESSPAVNFGNIDIAKN